VRLSSGHNIAEKNFPLQQIFKKSWKYAKDHCACFVDFERTCSVGCYSQVTDGRARRLENASTILRELYCSMVTKWTYSDNAQLLGYNGSFLRSSPMPASFGHWPKECHLKHKWQRCDFCKEITSWNFATKSAAMKFVKIWMPRYFSTERRKTIWHLWSFHHVTRMPQEKLHPQEKPQRFAIYCLTSVIASPTWLVPVLVWSHSSLRGWW